MTRKWRTLAAAAGVVALSIPTAAFAHDGGGDDEGGGGTQTTTCQSSGGSAPVFQVGLANVNVAPVVNVQCNNVSVFGDAAQNNGGGSTGGDSGGGDHGGHGEG